MATTQTYEEVPTIQAGHFVPKEDAQALRKAMKGLGTNEAGLINVLTKRTNSQIQEIALAFRSSFGKDLLKEVKSETSGNFEDTLVALILPRYDYLAERLYKATDGIGTKEKVLIDILCTASNLELKYIQSAYQVKYKKTLKDDIVGDTSGHFRRILVSLCAAKRDEEEEDESDEEDELDEEDKLDEEDELDEGLVGEDARALFKAGKDRLGTDESVFNTIIGTRSYQHLRAVFKEYETVAGEDIVRSIKSEFSGDIEDALITIVQCVKNRAVYFARRLRDSMKGLGTNDNLLIFLIVTRAEIDLANIKEEYNHLYNRRLADDIRSETSGDYRKTLLALVR